MKPEILLVVDVQVDFLPGGALGVNKGFAIIPKINELISNFKEKKFPIIYTKDWHTWSHCSFKHNKGPWPLHCLEHTGGAAFPDRLEIAGTVFHKGMNPSKEEYSALEEDGSLLEIFLKAINPSSITVAGIATDYCVKRHVIRLRELEFSVVVETNAIAGVADETTAEALQEMKAAGAILK